MTPPTNGLVSSSTLDSLREAVRGPVVARDDETYNEARSVYNGMIDKHPAAIVRAADQADVIAAVRFAAESDLDLSIRGGSHSVPGFGTNNDGLVIDLSEMRGIRVDPRNKTVVAQGGCRWGDLDHATHAFGMATVGGIVSTTGVAGLTLGGGIGYLTRGHGLSLDNLISADVITADGELKHASENENADLFWALRGGGGNFGVVTHFEFRLHPVSTIYGGPMFFEVEHARDVLEAFRDYIATAPRQLGAFFAWQIAPPLPFIPENRHGDTFCAIVACWAGPIEKGEEALKPLMSAAPVVAHHVGPAPYPALNSAFDPLLPAGLQHYWKANFVEELSEDLVAAHLEHGPKVPTVQSTMHIYPINGAVHDVPADATAFGNRDANFSTVIAGMWPDPKDNEKNIQWVRDYYAATAPFSREGGYINFQSEDDADRVSENYGAAYRRLRDVKKKYDPNNLFHMNQNIKPA
ncbi:MAG: FAD-binding oxidoreductase [Rhodothermia bacterium]|nr:FAD-binding oxidoreductase [Rhodothermia bacterium]